MWKELAQEFPKVFNQCTEQTLWNEVRDIELRRPLTQEEETRRQKGIPYEQITQDRLWNKRQDGIEFKVPTKGRGRGDLPVGVQEHVRRHQTLYS